VAEEALIRVAPATTDAELRGAALLRWEWKGDADSSDAFVDEFVAWARDHADTHTCFVAETEGDIVGCAWLAVGLRVPGPANFTRATGDVQSVYVTPSARGAGAGSALLRALLDRAEQLGLERVVVHSSEEAVSFYRGLGFAASDILLDRKLR